MTEILIVDDEDSIRRSLAGILSDEGFSTREAIDGESALEEVRREEPDGVLLDIAMPGRDGLEILEELRKGWPALPVMMMSGHGTIETAVRATQLGAFDFVEKPLSIDKMLITIRHALDQARLERENRRLRAEAIRARTILGETQPLLQLKEQINQAAPTNGWALITGENGTGKELVARQIHVRSRRADGPFVEVNCAAIPEGLIESELFGHEKGAFTGAVAQKRGKFELADGGTIFLDEIADMSLRTQAKVLRILQEHEFERVGGTETFSVDVRVIAATNKNLQEEIHNRSFREDLYYRLNVIPLHVPPLRERRGDIPILANAFVDEFCADSGGKQKKVAPKAMSVLASYSWPGNVRELRNLMERLVLMTPAPQIEVNDLPVEILEDKRHADVEGQSLEVARRIFERDFLINRLRENGWNISQTAVSIGLARESLSRKMRQFGIKAPRDGD